MKLDPIYLDFDMSEDDFLKYQRANHSGQKEVKFRLSDELRHTRAGTLDFIDNAIARHCHVWTPPADQGLFSALRWSWVRSCLRPHMRAPPSIVFLPMAIRGELSFPQGIPC